MKLCLINPNSTRAMNAGILEAAKRIVDKMPNQVELVITEVPESPALINSDADEVEAGYWTLQKAKSLADKVDGFLIACHSDPALSAIREKTGKPVEGIGHASLEAAQKFAKPYAILAISEQSIPRKKNMARKYGFPLDFDTIATGYTEEMDRPEVLQCLKSAAQKALAQKPYGCFVLGCAGMALVAKELQEELGVPIVDGVEEAVKTLTS